MSVFETPEELLGASVCLHSLSKDAKGALERMSSIVEACAASGCERRQVVHSVQLALSTHTPCDVLPSTTLDGNLTTRLVTLFVNGDGNRRGTHAAAFSWKTKGGLVVEGVMAGVTNLSARRRRPPAPGCLVPGVMEGRFSGRVVAGTDPSMKDAVVTGTYLLTFDPSTDGGQGAVKGTFEGLLAQRC